MSQDNIYQESKDHLYNLSMEMRLWIRAARQYAKLTQEQLGEALGVTKGNISAWENGHHDASLEQLNKVAEITKYPEALSAFVPSITSNQDNWKQWPFERIDQKKIRNLSKEQIIILETALIMAATQFEIDIKKTSQS